MNTPLTRLVQEFILAHLQQDVEDMSLTSSSDFPNNIIYETARPLGLDYETLRKIHPPIVFFLITDGCVYIRVGTSQNKTQLFDPCLNTAWVATDCFTNWSGFNVPTYEESALYKVQTQPDAKLIDAILENIDISDEAMRDLLRYTNHPNKPTEATWSTISEDGEDTVDHEMGQSSINSTQNNEKPMHQAFNFKEYRQKREALDKQRQKNNNGTNNGM